VDQGLKADPAGRCIVELISNPSRADSGLPNLAAIGYNLQVLAHSFSSTDSMTRQCLT